MRFGLLGPVLVERDGSLVEIKAAMPRTVLAVLLLDANSVVSVEVLVDILWGGSPPVSATASLHNHVMRLRRLLGDEGGARIRAVAPGFQIDVEPGELDLDVFEALCAAGAADLRAWRWAKASAGLAAALALWRGEPAADVPALGGSARIGQLLEARLQAFEGRIEADLELGRHREVIGELRALTAEHPLREAFHGQLMLALYRADRQAEALEVFQGLRRTLVDELGVEPSPSVQQLHRRILGADPELAAPAPTLTAADVVPTAGASTGGAGAETAGGPGYGGRRGPRFQLPADTRVFTGRERELCELIELSHRAPAGTESGMVVISAIDGMAGIGKTALAVHAAHRIRDSFPDGQLFLDLHGYTTGLDPMDVGDALDGLLRSLGTPPQSIPEDLGERAAFYRDRLSGTKTLIVLDNASSTVQVRPLLPGTPGCLVLVTSRRRLVGLDDAHTLALDILPEADAIALLHKGAGPGRIPAHHPAILELIALCGHMPLAIRITAARLRLHRALRIEDVVAQLRDESARLENLQDEVEDRDLTVVFDLSYQDLAGAEQHLFRRLGLIPGPDLDAYAAAGLTGTDHRTAERLLESLLDHNLLTQHAPGRYQFHDLIRVYARNLADNDPAEVREAALERLLDYYQHTADSAGYHLARQTRPRPAPAVDAPAVTAPGSPAQSPTVAPDLPDRARGLAWLRTERANLLAAIAHAGAHGQAARLVALTGALAPFLQQEGPWSQAAVLHRAASTAAHENGDPLREANALHDLGRVSYLLGDFPAALSQFERAQSIYLDLGNRLGEANTMQDVGRVQEMSGEYSTATGLHERALEFYVAAGDRLGEGNALSDVGRASYLKGDSMVAIELQKRALAIFQETGHEHGEASSYYNLGRVLLTAGQVATATDYLGRALVLYQSLGQRHGEANVLQDLGRVHLATGDVPAAAAVMERSLALYQDLGSRLGEAYALWDLGRVRLANRDYPAANDLYEQAMQLQQELNNRNGIANAQLELGRVRHATGDYPAAAAFFDQARAIFNELGDPQGASEVVNCMGALTADTTGPAEALAVYREALDLTREAVSPIDEARALEGAARCLERLGERKAALADLREAVAILQRIGAGETAAAEAYLAAMEAEADEDTCGEADNRSG